MIGLARNQCGQKLLLSYDETSYIKIRAMNPEVENTVVNTMPEVIEPKGAGSTSLFSKDYPFDWYELQLYVDGLVFSIAA